ncbi:MAG: hypothetical protein MPN21_03900 [Thermoanaerobaculia bacterium]|nr:hypothetical protein [Thermoanaerobaculia bacterium]
MRWTVVLPFVLILLLVPTGASAEPKVGDVIQIDGQVVDGQNRWVSHVEVVLEASRTKFSLRRLERTEGEFLRMPVRTDDEGRFSFEWRWDGHHNTFSLGVGLEVQRGGRPDFELVEQLEISDIVRSGGPVNVRLEVPEAGYLRWLRGYLEGKATADEEKIYRDQGRPDRVETSDHFRGETTWWYFDEGEAYRFRQGRFDQVVHFDPVPDPVPAGG